MYLLITNYFQEIDFTQKKICLYHYIIYALLIGLIVFICFLGKLKFGWRNEQLNLEREAGRVFRGWKEGRIYFAPTYKYSQNSDSYAGETVKSKKKRRTPAW